MTEHERDFGDRLVATEMLDPAARQQYEQQMQAIRRHRLTRFNRFEHIVGIVVLLVCGGGMLVGSFFVKTPGAVPRYVVVLFGTAFAALAAFKAGMLVRTLIRGFHDPQGERADRVLGTQATMIAFGFMAMLLMALGLAGLITSGGVFMVGMALLIVITIGIECVRFRVEQAELALREKLLQMELRQAELTELLRQKG